MERTEQDYQNLLDETVNYYKEDLSRRATYFDGILVESSCLYKTSEGRMCAVGRCLDQDVMDYEKYNEETSADSLIEELTDKVFREEYQGFDSYFWQDLQNLHDVDGYWNKDQLSDKGVAHYDFIVGNIKSNRYNIN